MLEQAPLYQQIAEHVHELIRVGTLRVGDRVPSVRRLSGQRRVSISTVLQAYRCLEDLGVIEARPQSGYYVRRASTVVEEPAPSKPPKRVLNVEASELIEALQSQANDPNVVAFGGGSMSPKLFPLERVRRVFSSVSRRNREALGNYGFPPGTVQLRRAVARRALNWGCRIDYRNVITTAGCTEAVNLCLRAVTKPGDLVALESPTFYGFLQLLQAQGLRALEIPTHPRTGISLEELEAGLAKHPVKAVLVMPNVSNPIGASMSDAAKKHLVELLAEKNVPMIEDHIYGDLHFGTTSACAAKAFDLKGNVMLCSSFSKTLAPGLKAGWVEPGRWHDRIRMLKFVSSGGTGELIELTAAELLESGGYERLLRQMRRRSETYVDIARGVIAESFPEGTRVTRPSGGYVLWVEMPKECNSVAMFEPLLDRGITIAPGPMFSASNRYANCFRISLGQPWSSRHEQALHEIGRLAKGASVRSQALAKAL